MRNKRIIVYLDTSDVSRFADIGTPRERESVAHVYEHLRRQLEHGDVEIRFSVINIAEIAKSGSAELARRKADVIERLCGTLCFRPFDEIWKREVWSVVQSDTKCKRFTIPYQIHSDQGLWMLDARGNVELNLDAELKTQLRQLTGRLNRAQRRHLKASLWQGDQLSQFGLSLLRAYWPDSVPAEITDRYPLNDADQTMDYFKKLLCGQINNATFEREVVQMLLRPTQMVRFIYEMDEIRTHCPQFIVECGDKIVRMVASLRADIIHVPQALRGKLAGFIPDGILRRPAVEAALRDRDRVRAQSLSDKQVGDRVYDADPGALPAVDLISRAAKVYTTQHARMPRNPNVSDGPDLMHLTYLPYCDIFRADTYMAELLKQCGPLVSARVARTLEELPSSIERLIASRDRLLLRAS